MTPAERKIESLLLKQRYGILFKVALIVSQSKSVITNFCPKEPTWLLFFPNPITQILKWTPQID